MSASKAKGTAAETAVVRYLQANGFPYVERRTLSGSQDKGDIAGIPGVVIEVKACARQELAAWMDEATIEAANASVAFGVVWHKRKGFTNPSQWYVTMDGETFIQFCLENTSPRQHEGDHR